MKASKKIISCVLIVAMLISGFSTYLQSGARKSTDVGAAQQQQMKMPIVIYDHLNDTLLFEYLNTDTSFGLTMYVDTPMGAADENSGKNLVEDELGPNGTPVYKKEVVERVAQIVKDTIEQVRTDSNYATRTDVSDLYRDITDMVLSEEPKETDIEINGKTLTLEELGWSFALADSSKTDSPDLAHDYFYDSQGNEVWKRDGDQIIAANGGTSNTATCDFGNLNAGEYRLYAWAVNNIDVSLTTPNGTQAVAFTQESDATKTGMNRDGKIYDFIVNGTGPASVTLTPTGDHRAEIMPFVLLKKDAEGNWVKEKDMSSRAGSVSADKIGWTVEPGSSWKSYPGGGITCDETESTKTYKAVDVNPGDTYRFRCGMNDGSNCKVWIEDENGNKLVNAVPVNYQESNAALDDRDAIVTIPDGVSKVRVYVENDASKTGTRRVGEIYMKKVAEARLGDYETSKAKYDGGAKLQDINTCMDYAYYFLNSFWSDTNGDITQKTNLYQTLTMDLMDNSDKYRFSNGQKINYDLENKNISQDLNTPGTTGLFPLDSSVLGNKSDLSAPFGVADGELTDEHHNYHYAMKAHCQFIYDTLSDLEFNFSGDDDVYLFINGKKAMDIGGAHGAVGGSVTLNYNAKSDAASEVERDNKSKQLAQSLGLQDGEVYDFDFFYLERHTSLSNITIETNMPLVQAGVTPKVTFRDKDGNVIPDGTEVQAGEKVNVEYDITSTTKISPNAPNKLTGLEITDNELGVFMGYDGQGNPKVTLGDAEVDDAITVTVKDKDGQPTKTITISKDDLNDSQKVAEFVRELKNIQLDNKESVNVSGLSRKMPADQLLKSELDVSVVAPEPYFDNNGQIQFRNEEVITLPTTAMVVPVNDPSISVKGILKDKDGNVLNKDANNGYKDEYLPKGSEVYPEFEMKADDGEMTDIKLDDSEGTGFVMDKNGIQDPNGFLNGNDTLKVEYHKADGTTETIELTKADIERNNEKYQQLKDCLGGNWKLGKGETITVSGLHKALDNAPIETKPAASATGAIPSYNAETEQLTVTNKTVNGTDSKKKAIPTVKVNFENGDHGTVEGDKEQDVVCNETVDSVPTKKTSDPGYSFIGWKKAGDTTDKIYTSQEVAAMEITDDTTFVAQWELGKVTVEFKAGEHGSVTGDATDKTQTIDYGTSVSTVPGTSEDNGYEFKGWKRKSDGQIYTEDEIKNLTFTDDDEFEAVFEPKKMSYIVKYVDEDGNEIERSKTVNDVPFGTDLTEYAVDKTGYDVDKDSEQFTMTTDGQEIIFTYKLKKLTVTYTSGENGSVDGDDNETVTYGDKPENVPTPKADKGYKFAGWTKKVTGGDSSVDDPKNEEITEDTVFEAVFVPVHSNYKVKYVDENGNEIFATKQGEETQVGKSVTETYVNVEGYELVSEKTVTTEISDNEEENVIVFTYRKVEEPTTVVEEETTVIKEKTTKKEKTIKKEKKSKETTTQETTTAPPSGNTGAQNTSMTSPKTGYGKQFTVLFMMLLASIAVFGISFRKMREE